MADQYPISVLSTPEKHTWTTQAARISALGLDAARYATLRTSFLACDGIDKTRNTTSALAKEAFAAEVRVWLEEELSDRDRRCIYGREGVRYMPGFAVYAVVAYFKRKWGEQRRKEWRRGVMRAGRGGDGGLGRDDIAADGDVNAADELHADDQDLAAEDLAGGNEIGPADDLAEQDHPAVDDFDAGIQLDVDNNNIADQDLYAAEFGGDDIAANQITPDGNALEVENLGAGNELGGADIASVNDLGNEHLPVANEPTAEEELAAADELGGDDLSAVSNLNDAADQDLNAANVPGGDRIAADETYDLAVHRDLADGDLDAVSELGGDDIAPVDEQGGDQDLAADQAVAPINADLDAADDLPASHELAPASPTPSPSPGSENGRAGGSDLSSPHGAQQELYGPESDSSDSGNGGSILSPADSVMQLDDDEYDSPPPAIPRKREHQQSPSPVNHHKHQRVAEAPMQSIRSDMDKLVQRALALADESLHGEMRRRYACFWDILIPPQDPGHAPAAAAVFRSSVDAVLTAGRYINYYIRVRSLQPAGASSDLETVLSRGEPSFQHIWGADARNSDIALPFQRLMATAFPVFLVAAGYSAGGKTYSLLLPNLADPPVLEVLLRQALQAQVEDEPLQVTVFTVLGKRTITTQLDLGVMDIAGFLQGLQTPGVGRDNGINPRSSRRHVLVEVRAAGKHLLSVLDLCGDETSEVRAGPLRGESNSIASDLVMLRALVARKLQWKYTPPLLARGCGLTRHFARHLGNFLNVHVVFFCDGDAESMSRLCYEWKPRAV